MELPSNVYNRAENGIPIRIESSSFEDNYKLASGRYDVYFKLLKSEFDVNDESIDNSNSFNDV